jgi:NosR/NirI family nitrous oxide reductase transcriptional regulator
VTFRESPLRRLFAMTASVAALVLAATTVFAAEPAPTTLDCEALDCSAVMPQAARFRAVAEALYWEGVDEDGDAVGWVALSTDYVDIKAYSGKPLVTLVGLTPDGILSGARVIHHGEPILLVGIPEQALHDFVDFYAGKSPLQRIVVGRASREDMVSVDAISGATVTVLAQNQTILNTARALGRDVGVFEVGHVASGHFIAEDRPWTFAELIERRALGHMVVSEAEMGLEDTDVVAADLYFGIVDAPQVGRALLGDRNFDYYSKKLALGEHLFVVLNSGEYSFKGSAFVRGGIFDRIRLQQGLREISFRDTDYENLQDVAAEGAPEFAEGGLFFVRDGQLDPGSPYALVFLASHYDQRSAYSREFREFTAQHRLPESVYVVDEVVTGIPWRQAWLNRRVEVVVLLAYLLFVIGVFSARRYTTADPVRIKRLHMVSLVLGFVVLGVIFRAQPSVTQIFTATGSVIDEWRWGLFLSEPLIFILWIFIVGVSLTWGRGVFCGWVCPYGAMTELAFKLGEKIGLRSYELPDSLHMPLRYTRYVVLVVLVAIFLWDSILAEQLAEVEPFKSTFLVPFWTRHWGFGLWWVVLFAASFLSYRPFCRYLCPLGGGLALLGSYRPSGPRRRVFCGSCKICTQGCEPRAFRPDGSIDPRECLSCMDCEAVYRNVEVCPPLLGITRLEGRADLTDREQAKWADLQRKAEDL